MPEVSASIVRTTRKVHLTLEPVNRWQTPAEFAQTINPPHRPNYSNPKPLERTQNWIKLDVVERPAPQHQRARTWSLFERHKGGTVP